jgi:hypothetical protein
MMEYHVMRSIWRLWPTPLCLSVNLHFVRRHRMPLVETKTNVWHADPWSSALVCLIWLWETGSANNIILYLGSGPINVPHVNVLERIKRPASQFILYSLHINEKRCPYFSCFLFNKELLKNIKTIGIKLAWLKSVFQYESNDTYYIYYNQKTIARFFL